MDDRTFRDSGLLTIIARASEMTHTQAGKAAILAARPMHDAAAIQRELEMVDEAVQLLAEGYSLNLLDYEDCEPMLKRAQKNGVLSAGELQTVARVMRMAVDARAILNAGRLRAPTLYNRLGELPDLDDLTTFIEATFDEKGEIRDDASPELGRLRQRIRKVRDAIQSRLDAMLKRVTVQSTLQDEFVTLREGRYVLPVRVSHSPEVPGIIHGISNSGKTAFIEPEDVVRLNNRLVVAQEEARLEELRVLRGRTRALLGRLDDVRQGIGVLPVLDVLFAKARLARVMQAQRPVVGRDEPMDLRQVRNPLLVLHVLDLQAQEIETSPVVANDIALPGDKRVMVISGPNAGGKSVSLQSVALTCLMAYTGFLVPASEGSTVPLYDGVYTLIGDFAAIDQEVSTFTGQLKRIAGIFEAAQAKNTRVLALLDELGTGTEPRKGQVLAAAVVKTLAGLGVDTMVATHYDLLKQLGEQDPLFMNARMGVDAGLRPTYRLEPGSSGESNPFEIAKAVGFPEETVKLAESMLSRREVELDKALSEATALRDALRTEKAEVERLQQELTDLKNRYTMALQRVRQRADVLVAQARQEALEEVRRIKEEIRMIEKDVKGDGTVRRRRKRLDEVKQDLEQKIEAEKPKKQAPKHALLNMKDLKPGAQVKVVRLDKEGTLLEVDERRNRAMVAVSGMRMWFRQDDLAPVDKSAGQGRADRAVHDRQKGAQPPVIERDKPVDMTASNTLKLVGMRVDDALSELEKRLDRAFLQEEKVLAVVHGIGTSALRNAVRAHLKTSSYPIHFRSGMDEEGGEAVTVIFFD